MALEAIQQPPKNQKKNKLQSDSSTLEPRDRPIRLLIVANSLEDDAPTSMAFAVARAAHRSRRFRCRVLGLSRGGIMARELEKEGIPWSKGGVAAGLPQLVRTLREFQPEIVHFHLTRPLLLGLPSALALNVPAIIATHHGSHEWCEKGRAAEVVVRCAFPAIASRANCIIAVSESARAELLRHGLAHEKTGVIHNGIDTLKFGPTSASMRRRVLSGYFPEENSDNLLLVGCAGNLRKVKGHHFLVQAAAAVVRRHSGARFLVWGEGPERAALEKQIDTLQLQSHFRLAGRSEALETEIATCDVYVQPSLRESFGLAAGEAMACAVPVVLSRAGGLPELGGDIAIYADPGNAMELSKAINTLLSSRDEREHRGMACRNRILLNFTLEKMCRTHLDLYETMVPGSVR